MHYSAAFAAVLMACLAVANPAPTPRKAAVRDAPSGSFEEECLKVHNEHRAIHSAGPLVWNNEMANYAAGVAGKCDWNHAGGPYGENFASGDGTPTDDTKFWYSENTLYDYANGSFSDDTGHFTQIVWKGAKEVGCGMVSCDGAGGISGKLFVCNYDTGNIDGLFQENVLPPTGGKNN